MSHEKITAELQEMLESPHYKSRWGTLAAAAQVIAEQERRIAELERASAAPRAECKRDLLAVFDAIVGGTLGGTLVNFDTTADNLIAKYFVGASAAQGEPADALRMALEAADRLTVRIEEYYDGADMFGWADVRKKVRAISLPPDADNARDQALEDAAQLCAHDSMIAVAEGYERYSRYSAECAAKIRALKSAASAAEPHPERKLSMSMFATVADYEAAERAQRLYGEPPQVVEVAPAVEPEKMHGPFDHADALIAALESDDPKPSCCSEDPTSCPNNEGHGCWCNRDVAASAPRFHNVSCSQCGQDFGPGDSGYSSCGEHQQGGDQS